jgi:tetratricopeptide (TPR) repeat protein
MPSSKFANVAKVIRLFFSALLIVPVFSTLIYIPIVTGAETVSPVAVPATWKTSVPLAPDRRGKIQTLFAQGQTDSALESAQSLVTASPEAADANYVMAWVLSSTSCRLESLPYLESAKKAAPDCADIPYLHAGILCDLGRLAEAQKVILDFEKRYGHVPDVECMKGRVMVMSGDANGGCRVVERVVKDFPQALGYRLHLVDCLTRSGRPEDAYLTLIQAPAEVKTSPSYLNDLYIRICQLPPGKLRFQATKQLKTLPIPDRIALLESVSQLLEHGHGADARSLLDRGIRKYGLDAEMQRRQSLINDNLHGRVTYTLLDATYSSKLSDLRKSHQGEQQFQKLSQTLLAETFKQGAGDPLKLLMRRSAVLAEIGRHGDPKATLEAIEILNDLERKVGGRALVELLAVRAVYYRELYEVPGHRFPWAAQKCFEDVQRVRRHPIADPHLSCILFALLYKAQYVDTHDQSKCAQAVAELKKALAYNSQVEEVQRMLLWAAYEVGDQNSRLAVQELARKKALQAPPCAVFLILPNNVSPTDRCEIATLALQHCPNKEDQVVFLRILLSDALESSLVDDLVLHAASDLEALESRQCTPAYIVSAIEHRKNKLPSHQLDWVQTTDANCLLLFIAATAFKIDLRTLEAARLFERAAAASKNAANAQEFLAMATGAFDRVGDAESAYRVGRRVTVADKDRGFLRIFMRTCVHLQKYDEALIALNKLLTLDPVNREYLGYKSELLKKLHKPVRSAVP